MTETNHNSKNYQNVSVEDTEKSTKKITGEVTTEHIERKRSEALDKLAQDVEIEGFRKGKAPKDVAEKKIGERRLMEEAANVALAEIYPQILAEHEIRAIGQPQIAITKMAPGNPLGFTITTAVVPEVKLPNYKKIAEKERGNMQTDDTSVSDGEVKETIDQIRKNIALQEKQKTRQELAGDGEADPVKQEDITDEDLPELNDEFVKKLGEFESVDDFTAKLKENIKREKEMREREKVRMTIAEKLIEKTEADLPEIVVDSELQKMLAQFKDDIARAGMEWGEYLKKLSKNEDDLKKEWRPNAEKKAMMQLIMNKIAAEEDIRPDKEILEAEVKRLTEYYPQADKRNIEIYVETYLTNEEVLKFLEGKTQKKKEE